MWQWLIRRLVDGRSVLNTLYTGRRVTPRAPTHLRATFTMNRQVPALRSAHVRIVQISCGIVARKRPPA
jgi:hypothetical protein